MTACRSAMPSERSAICVLPRVCLRAGIAWSGKPTGPTLVEASRPPPTRADRSALPLRAARLVPMIALTSMDACRWRSPWRRSDSHPQGSWCRADRSIRTLSRILSLSQQI
jgi:hypothetical protein